MVKADITDVVVDAIVHPTNTTFYLGGQVGSAIARRGGYKIQNIMNEMQRTKGHLSTCAGNYSTHLKFFNYFLVLIWILS